jgi:YtkA-like
MGRELMLASSAFAIAMSLSGITFGGADDYFFEPVKAEIRTSNVATLAVRLVHKPTGKPVTDARIMETRLVMPHHGSAEMTSAIAPLPSPVFAFKAPLMMEGDWLLSIAAKVPGQSETVIGTITFRAIR